MSILTVFLVLIVAGVVLYLVNSYIPMDGKIKRLLNIAVIVILILWLLKVFGVWGHLAGVTV